MLPAITFLPAGEAWLTEQRKIRQDMANAFAHAASLEQEVEKRREKDTMERLAGAERSRQLREQIAEQRQLCRAAQHAVRAAEGDLATLQAQRRTPRPTLVSDTGRVKDLKARG